MSGSTAVSEAAMSEAAMASQEDKFLPSLTKASRIVHLQGETISTCDFTAVCDRILVALDKLGVVISFAKTDMEGRCHPNHALNHAHWVPDVLERR